MSHPTPLRSRLAPVLLAVAALAAPGAAVTAAESAAVVASYAAPEAPRSELRTVHLHVPLQGDAPDLDWGIVPPGTELWGKVVIHNDTGEPLRILAVRPSCKCTALDDPSGETIAPGARREMEVVIEPRNATGTSTNSIRYLFDGQSLVEVGLRAEIARAVRSTPPYADATEGEEYGVVTIRAVDGRPFRVLSTTNGAPIFADGHDPSRDPARSEYVLVWNVAGYDPSDCTNAKGEVMPMWWYVETDHPGAPIVDLRVRHNPCTLLDMPRRGKRDWYLSQNHEVAGELGRGATHRVSVEMKWLPRTSVNDVVDRVESEDPALAVADLQVDRSGDVITVTLELRVADDAAAGVHYSVLQVHGQKPGSSQRLPVLFRVPRTG